MKHSSWFAGLLRLPYTNDIPRMRNSRNIIALNLLAIITLSFFGGSAVSFAAPATSTYNEDYYSTNEVLFYDPRGGSCSTGGGGIVEGAGTNPEEQMERAKVVFNVLTSSPLTHAGNKPLTGMQAAAFIGNFSQESGLSSTVVNSIGATGLAQWLGGRKTGLVAFASQQGKDYTDLTIQAEYVVHELNGSEKGILLDSQWLQASSANDIAAATVRVRRVYERPGESEANDPARIQAAEKFYAAFGDGAGVTSAGSCSGSGPAGDVVYYSQLDSKWSAKPYGSSTFGPSGCGPTSMAMILATLVDKSITPVDVGAIAGAQGLGTTSHANLIDGVNKKWNLSISKQSLTTDQAVDFVSSGKGLVWIGGSGPVPFTTGGHMIAIVGVKDGGNTLTIADPYNPPHEKIKDYPRSLIDAYSHSKYGVPKP